MPLHESSTRLLERIPEVVADLSIELREVTGEACRFGDAVGGDAAARVDLPTGGELLLHAGPGGEVAAEFVTSLLQLVADRERLESDMASMSDSSLQLMEVVSEIGSALPKLAGGTDEAATAQVAVDACSRAARAKRVVYLSMLPNKGLCEVKAAVTHPSVSEDERDDPSLSLDAHVSANEGLLGEVLGHGDLLQRSVDPERRLGEPGKPEYLAQELVLAVPVTYGHEDKRSTIGVLVLCDRVSGVGEPGEQVGQFLQAEVEVAQMFALMLGAVIGARKTAELGKELTTAQAIQRQILPDRPVKVAGFDIAADYQACGAVGGDYFDYVRMADGRTMVVVADVSGHNLASGMMMVSARATLRTLAAVRSSPVQVFEEVASTMFDDLMGTERFLTAAAVVLEADADSVEYVSAGHNDLMVYRAATDCVERIASESTILGFLPAPSYESRRVELAPGDCALLFTDGITEATDECGDMYGEDRLCCVLAQLAQRGSARAIVDGVVASVAEFTRSQTGSDDITAVVIRREGKRRRA